MNGLIAPINVDAERGRMASINAPRMLPPNMLIPKATRGCHQLSAANNPIIQKTRIPIIAIDDMASCAWTLAPLSKPLFL